jgi:hypothetical protein
MQLHDFLWIMGCAYQ